MMAGKNQAALAVCAQTKVIFPFKNIEMTHCLQTTSEIEWAVMVFILYYILNKEIPRLSIQNKKCYFSGV